MHDDLTRAGARVAGVSVDPPGANAAMVDKLELPFPLLSDPDGSEAIKPYDLWHAQREIAYPAVVVIGPQGDQVLRQDSRDFADRLPEDDLLSRLRELGLPPTAQEPPVRGEPQPGERAFPAEGLAFYFRGVKFAGKAMGMRVPEAKAEGETLTALAERYIEEAKRLTG